jgi:hypothetical protein
MREYEITFVVEWEDECDYQELIIKADSIYLALFEFQRQKRVFKRVTQIKELAGNKIK